MELLIPNAADLMGWAGVLVAVLVFIGLGRLVAADAVPEAALIAGWGVAVVVLTLWGLAVTASLRLPGWCLVGFGVLGLALRRLKPSAWRGIARLVLVTLPLLAVMASVRPSLPDTFLNLLPNAAYLYDHGFFPADDRAAAYSLLPGAPYDMQLAAFVASLPLPHFPPSAMIVFNLFLQLGLALLLARVVEGKEDAPDAPPSWRAVAAGFLLATLVNPGFVTRYHLSAYSEASVAVTTAFAAWLAADALERRAGRRPARQPLMLLALTLAVLANIKQDSIALAGGLAICAIGLAALRERTARWRAIAPFVAAAAPAAILYLAWRWYVLSHFAAGELKLLPFAEWHWAFIPEILRSMAGEMLQKAYFFGCVLLAFCALAWRWRRRGLDRTTCLAAIFAGTAILYNAALFFTYIAHFYGEMGATAHSYFRYNTHLGPLLVLVLVLVVRESAQGRRWELSSIGGRGLAAALVGASLISPLVFFRFVRFDLEVPQQRVWQLATLARAALDRDPRLALLLPGDGGSVSTMAEGLIRFTPPRHLDAELQDEKSLTPRTLEALAAAGFRFALLSCAPPSGLAGVPGGGAGLLEREGSLWHAVAVWDYPPSMIGGRWSHVLSEAPLCLGPAS